MAKSLILVANARRARCFERDGPGSEPTELFAFVYPQARHSGRPAAGDVSGDAGKGHGRTAHGGTQFEPHTPVRTVERRMFARELAKYVNEAMAGRQCDSLTLIASAPMLGELRSSLGAPARKILKASLTGDLTRLQGRELGARIDRASALPG
jgi:protein required for attachment to host cells